MRSRGQNGSDPGGAPPWHARCLTELSAAALLVGALGLSGVLWLALLAVL